MIVIITIFIVAAAGNGVIEQDKVFPLRIMTERSPLAANFHAAGALVTTSLKNAMDVARCDALRRDVTEIVIIGGEEIYAQTLDLAHRIDLRLVHAMP